VPLKVVPKAGYECTLEKSTNQSKGKPEQNFLMRRSEIVSFFKEANKNFILNFLWNYAGVEGNIVPYTCIGMLTFATSQNYAYVFEFRKKKKECSLLLGTCRAPSTILSPFWLRGFEF
jgi:hypothetical protein